MTQRKTDKKKEKFKVKTFPVPFTLGEKKENISISTKTPSKLSKRSEEEIINHAFNFQLKGNISEAKKYYQKLITKGCNNHRVFSNYGIILKDLGQLKKAAIYIRKAIKLNPDFFEAHYNLGIVLKDLGKLKEAEISTRKAIKINPDFALAHSNLGNILRDLGQLKEAEFSTRKAIELNPDFALAYYNLGRILRDLGQLKEAEIKTRKAIKINPDYAEAYSNLGSILRDLGKLQEAEISYTKSIAIKPGFADAIMNRWQLYCDQKKFELALRDSDSCNTKSSRACSLETLYALGKIDEIYKRIEHFAELDNKNIRMSAFASFIAEKENKDTALNFCKSPLSFLYYSNIKFHLKNHVEFIKDIINELSNIEMIWEPSNKTTRNGFQTPTNINLFSNSSKEIARLRSIILNELDSYHLKFEKESCSYIQKWPSTKNLVGWHVILKKQGYQEAHIHPGGWLSGVIYLKVVPSLGKDEGGIEFSLNGPNYSNINSPKLIHQPKAGDLVLFPSSLHHRTIPFSTDTDRIVIAFDLIPD